mmetsp:Transcript_153/g.452  ORF Transcript_153/g.452 Transcript_153/m.452 type:complete len:306 (-) Transcript_153:248-1165(-)
MHDERPSRHVGRQQVVERLCLRRRGRGPPHLRLRRHAHQRPFLRGGDEEQLQETPRPPSVHAPHNVLALELDILEAECARQAQPQVFQESNLFVLQIWQIRHFPRIARLAADDLDDLLHEAEGWPRHQVLGSRGPQRQALEDSEVHEHELRGPHFAIGILRPVLPKRRLTGPVDEQLLVLSGLRRGLPVRMPSLILQNSHHALNPRGEHDLQPRRLFNHLVHDLRLELDPRPVQTRAHDLAADVRGKRADLRENALTLLLVVVQVPREVRDARAGRIQRLLKPHSLAFVGMMQLLHLAAQSLDVR